MRFRPSRLENTEDIEKYRPGGFHPVHLHDVLANGRYRVSHKLGFGGFSTVWLARDTADQRILEHLKAQRRDHPGYKHVALLFDMFTLEGSNGRHLCLMFELLGPSVTQYYQCPGLVAGNRRLRGDRACRVALQGAEAVDFLHAVGVVHGDSTPSNALLRFGDLDSWTKDDIYARFGHPVKDELVSLGDAAVLHSAPEYVVESVATESIDGRWLEESIPIIDFGISFAADDPPPEILGTPAGYCAPELLFDTQASHASDVWAMACTFFAIRADRAPFEG